MEEHPVKPSAAAALGALLLAVILGSCSADRAAVEVWRGNSLFGRGEDAMALLSYFQALDRPAGRRREAWIRYDIGSAYVSVGERGPGIRTLREALENAGPGEGTAEDGPPRRRSRWLRELQFRTRFNLAVAAYERGDYPAAAAGFAAALRVRPDSWDAKVNLELSLGEQASRAAAGGKRPAAPKPAEAGPESRELLDKIRKEERPAWLSSQQSQQYAEDW
jgi:tetratricopeptide (TPR) repeat protein